MTVRTASLADADALAALLSGWVAERDASVDPVVAGFGAELAAWMAEDGRHHRCLIAELDGRVIGAIWLALLPRVPRPGRMGRRSGDIQSFVVLPEHRGRGIGRRLLDAALALADAEGVEHTTVHGSPGAMPLYRRAGFRLDDTLLGRRRGDA